MTTEIQSTELGDGLRALAAFADANPELAQMLASRAFDRVLVWTAEKERVAAFARAGARAKAAVSKHQNDSWAGVDLGFGPVSLHVYIDRDEVCERIVTGSREVTEEVPDPEALAAVPKVIVTKTVEEVEWRCMPLLADERPDMAAIAAKCGCPVRYAPEIRGDVVDTLVEHTPGCIALDEDMAAIAAEVPDELAPVVA